MQRFSVVVSFVVVVVKQMEIAGLEYYTVAADVEGILADLLTLAVLTVVAVDTSAAYAAEFDIDKVVLGLAVLGETVDRQAAVVNNTVAVVGVVHVFVLAFD